MPNCLHGVEVGQACDRCTGGVANRKRRNGGDNIAPIRVMPPPRIAHSPVRPPSQVGGMHALVSVGTSSSLSSSSSSSSSASASSPLASRSTLTNIQLLNALMAYLGEKDPSEALVDTVSARESTCWNWALHGAAMAAHDPDANWAYLYVSRSKYGYVPDTHDPLAGRDHSVLALLTQAREQWDLGGRLSQKRQDDIQTLVLRALCAFNGLREVGAGDLELALYYVPSRTKADGLMYMHFEFIYQGAITITKGNGEQLKAFNGESGLSEGAPPRRVSIFIDPRTLSGAHATALRDLVRQIPDS